MSGIHNIRRVTTYDASIPFTNNVQVNGADTVYPVNVNGIPVTNTNLIEVDGADNIQVYGNEVQFVNNIESTDTNRIAIIILTECTTSLMILYHPIQN